ncbi:MAG TPA: aspartate aminotransferase family protein [Flavobacteriales bacterium]|nr:aspartate aminotransferase family protein [Flavobacteriales bacterium]
MAVNNTFLFYDSNLLDLEVSSVKGSEVFGTDGKRYIDLTSGWCVSNFGLNNTNFLKFLQRNNVPAYVSPTLQYKPREKLARMLLEMAPGNFQKVIRATGGSEAMEAAMQIAVLYTGRSKFISVEGEYHGNTFASGSIGSLYAEKDFAAVLPGCIKVKAPLTVKSLQRIETRLRKKDIAAFIMEPVLMGHGVVVPETGFMEGLERLCKKHNTLLVIDEIATGFGRTGKLFATEHYTIQPDVLCMAKALSGGYAPLGATLITDTIYRKIKNRFSFYSTYGWHPISVYAGIYTLDWWKVNGEKTLMNIRKLNTHIHKRLLNMKFKYRPSIQSIGLAFGIHFEKPKYAGKIKDRCFENGLLVDADDGYLSLFPVLNMDVKLAGEAMDLLEKSI